VALSPMNRWPQRVRVRASAAIVAIVAAAHVVTELVREGEVADRANPRRDAERRRREAGPRRGHEVGEAAVLGVVDEQRDEIRPVVVAKLVHLGHRAVGRARQPREVVGVGARLVVARLRHVHEPQPGGDVAVLVGVVRGRDRETTRTSMNDPPSHPAAGSPFGTGS
jgi:hypothetical protein